MDIPSAFIDDDCNLMPFDDYLRLWPSKYADFPKCLLESWVHRHWTQFKVLWYPLGVLEWRYEKRTFDADQLMEIGACTKIMCSLDHWGKELFKSKQRRETWVAKYMLQHGKAPVPLLVLEGEKKIANPQCPRGEKSVTRYQLIEGHMRTAYLRAMIKENYATLSAAHEVWVATKIT